MLAQALLARSEAVFAVLDLEMTGLDADHDQICEIGLVRMKGGELLDRYQTLVRPTVPMTETARQIHRISDEELASAPAFSDIVDTLCERLTGSVLVGHHIRFDHTYLQRAVVDAGRTLPEMPLLDTLELSRSLLALRSHRLGSVCSVFGVPTGQAHRALDDAEATARCLLPMLDLVGSEEQASVGELLARVSRLAPDSEFRKEQMALFERCLEERRTVWVEYVSRQDGGGYEVARREFEIWKLAPPRMQGFCRLRQGERVFRVERVRFAEAGSNSYELPSFRERI